MSLYIDDQITVVAPPTPQSPHLDTLTKVTALARFEFEPGQGNNGTKIMMVEWHDEDKTRDRKGVWQVSWSGKNTVFTAENNAEDTQRLYFLLPPGSVIPPHITIAYQSSKPAESSEPEDLLRMTVNPLPAIFTPELGATAKASGKKGVLHTIWAKKRLQSLQKEIQREEDSNLEGIALEMAKAEKEWIENNFGISSEVQRPLKLDLSNTSNNTSSPPISPGLQSPKSPGGRRLAEKLRGLSIATSDKELSANGVNTPTRESHPLSPETSDMAYSSFSAFHNQPSTQQKPVSNQPGGNFASSRALDQQSQSIDARLNAFVSDPNGQVPSRQSPQPAAEDDADSDELFAVALSPRSPDDPKSPFSIPSSKVGAFAEIKGMKS